MNKMFDYNDNFNLYSLKLDNEVGAKLTYGPDFTNSSFELKLVSKTGRTLSSLNIEREPFFIKSVEYVDSNVSSPRLIINYEHHDPVICDLTPLWAEINADLDTKVDKTNSANKIYGTDANGAQTTYDKDSFGQVDDVRYNGVSVVNNKIANIQLNLDNGTGTNSVQQKSSVRTIFKVSDYSATGDILNARLYLANAQEIGAIDTGFTVKEIKQGLADNYEFAIVGATGKNSFSSSGGSSVGDNSFAVGFAAFSLGYSDVVLSQQAVTINGSNFVFGKGSAAQNESISFGLGNLTKSRAAYTAGYKLKNTNKLYKQVQGKLNQEKTDTIYEFGNGTERSYPTSVRLDLGYSGTLNYGSQLTLSGNAQIQIGEEIFKNCIVEYDNLQETPFNIVSGVSYPNDEHVSLEDIQFRIRRNAFEVLNDGRAKLYAAPVDDEDVVRKVDIASLAPAPNIDSISAGGTPLTPDENKNVNIPTAAYGVLGVIKTNRFDGIQADSTGYATLYPAENNWIDNIQYTQSPITVGNYVYAVKKALSGTHHLTLDASEQVIARSVLGIDNLGTRFTVAQLLPTADATTWFDVSKTIYLVPASTTGASNVYNEFITIRSGSAAPYTYSWEQIGSTEVDLTNYVQKSTTIAGIDLQDNITKSELLTALNVEDGAQVNVLEGLKDSAGNDLSIVNKSIQLSKAAVGLGNVADKIIDVSPIFNSSNYISSGGVYNALLTKLDKVNGATNGNFAGFNSNGDLVDSGSAPSDFVNITSQANKVYGTDNLGASTLYSLDAFSQVDDVQVNGVSILSNKIANIITNTAYNASTNKIATMSDIIVPNIDSISVANTPLTPDADKNVNIPYGTDSVAGVAKWNRFRGVGITNGVPYLAIAQNSQIDNSDLPLNQNFALAISNYKYAVSKTYLSGSSAPTTSTIANFVGQLYLDTTNNKTYQCTEISNTDPITYTWVQLIRSTDYARYGTPGVVEILEGGDYGVNYIYGSPTYHNNCLSIVRATNNNILDKQSLYKPIVPANLDFAVKTSITTNTISLTDAEKSSAQSWLGIVSPNIDTISIDGTALTPDANKNVNIPITLTGTDIPDTSTSADFVGQFYISNHTEGSSVVTRSFQCTGKTTQNNSTTYQWRRVLTNELISSNGFYGIKYLYSSSYGGQGPLTIYPAPENKIDERNNSGWWNPITTSNLDYAVKRALTDGIGAAYTTVEQTAAKARLGIVDVVIEDYTEAI